MNSGQNEIALTLTAKRPAICNKTSQVSAIQRAESGAADYVPHVSAGQVKLMASVAGKNKRHGERNALLIKTLFDGSLRVSEGLGIRPCDLQQTQEGWLVNILGKGSKPGQAAITATIAAELQAYAYRQHIGEVERIFSITRSQAFRIVTATFREAGIRQPSRKIDHVGAVHILRHSGAIERLKQSGNPKSVQNQLRHKSALLTLRYLKTLSADESLKIQQSVELW